MTTEDGSCYMEIEFRKPRAGWTAWHWGFLLIHPHERRDIHPEDGGSMVLRNAGILSHDYTALQPED